jgi:hypothetical protein
MKMRKLDVEIFWPACVAKAAHINEARAAFAYHAMNEPNWTRDMTEPEIVEYVKALGA